MEDELEHLENEGWRSLCTVTGSELHGRGMPPGTLMMPANGQWPLFLYTQNPVPDATTSA